MSTPFSKISSIFILLMVMKLQLYAQALIIPNNTINYKCAASRTIQVTEIDIIWNAPGVKGREGKIFGTDLAPYGLQVLGFGSDVASPWRAGADECTTISFSTDVKINGQDLVAGKYAFFILLQSDTCTLIFNKNVNEWGSYFYDSSLDVLRVKAVPNKNMPNVRERLNYDFIDQKANEVTIVLDWDAWRIPMKVEIDAVKTVFSSIQQQMTSGLGFDPPSLIQAARWCLNNNVHFEEANNWINRATDPNLGGIFSFQALSTKAGILEKMGQIKEAQETMVAAYDAGSLIELHQVGRQLLSLNKVDEAMKAFEKNFTKHNGQWPSNVGMMRGYSAKGNLKMALEHARLALPQAPDDVNLKNLEKAIMTLESGHKI